MTSKIMIATVLGVGALGLLGGKTAYHSYRVARAYDVNRCKTPVMHLEKAGANVCLEPNISWVDLTFERPVQKDAFVNAISSIEGIDLATSRSDEKEKLFRIVFYMSRTSDTNFITDLSAAIDDPNLYTESN